MTPQVKTYLPLILGGWLKKADNGAFAYLQLLPFQALRTLLTQAKPQSNRSPPYWTSYVFESAALTSISTIARLTPLIIHVI